MLSNFDLPSVDHLIEGVHYTIVDWDFAQSAPAEAPKPDDGKGCPEGEKMVFGACRKVGGAGTGEKDWDTSKDTEQEKKIGEEAKKQKSSFDANKPVTVGGKKYGWAKKNGKPVLVEWGSVAGIKKVGPKQPAAGGGRGGRGGRSGGGSGGANVSASTIEGWKKALEKHRASGNDAAAAAVEEMIRKAGG